MDKQWTRDGQVVDKTAIEWLAQQLALAQSNLHTADFDSAQLIE